MKYSTALILLSALAPSLALAEDPAPSRPTTSAGTRTERDLLGPKQVPADAYYGVQTARALENFRISNLPMNVYPEFIQAYAMVKLAAARANAKVGGLKPNRL